MLLLLLTTLRIVLIVVLLAVAVAGVVYFVRLRRRRPVATVAEEVPGVAGDESFEARIPEYAATIRQWFDTHPYFNQAFKLTDVQAVVPLNRTYLSRIFNEGLGESFSDYVRDRRMAEAMRLLTDGPDTPIAEHCGFASHSSFHRAFVRFTGMKPGDYRSGNKPA